MDHPYRNRRAVLSVIVVLVAISLVAILRGWGSTGGKAGDPALARGNPALGQHSGELPQPSRRRSEAISANYAPVATNARGVVVHPSSWRPTMSDSHLHVNMGVDWCTGFRTPWVDRVAIVKRDAAVVLTAYVAYPWPSRPGKAEECLGVVMMLDEAIPLEMLGKGVSVYDGVIWPPIKRVSNISSSPRRR